MITIARKVSTYTENQAVFLVEVEEEGQQSRGVCGRD